jgi:HTH-type transcriptional regulator/antitoxin HigA
MQRTLIKTKAEYKRALSRTIEIFPAAPGSKEDRELDLLLALIEDYEDRHIFLPDVDPIDVIKLKMEERGDTSSNYQGGLFL